MNCEVCGHPYDDDARFCADCGAELRQPHDGVSHTPPRPTPIDLRQAYGVTRAPVAGDDGDSEASRAAEAQPHDAEDPPDREAVVLPAPLPSDSRDGENPPEREAAVLPVQLPSDSRDGENPPEREAAVLPVQLPSDSRDGDIPPSTMTELLLRARTVYLRRFWLFFPLGVLPQIPLVISPLSVEEPSIGGFFSLIFSLLLFVATTAATIFAVAHLHVYGRIQLSRCLADAAQIALPMLLVQLIIGFSLVASIILMAVIIGFPLFIYFLATLFFAPHAVTIERLHPLFALARSRELVRGNMLRVILVGTLFILVAAFLHVAFIGPAMLFAPEDATTLNAAWAAAASFATPLLTIGGTLTYFDLRARREGYDLAQMKSEIERG